MTAMGTWISGSGRRIGPWVTVLTVSFSTMLALLTTAFQLAIEYRQQRLNLDTQLERVHTFLPSLAEAVWAFNDNQITLSLNALSSQPNIDRAIIIAGSDDRTQVWVSDDKGNSTRVVSRTYPLIHRDKQIATFEMVASLDGIFQHVLSLAIAVLLGNVITAVLVGGFMLVVVKAVATHRIERLASNTGERSI